MAIEEVKIIVCDNNFRSNLIFIHTIYGFLLAITRLETRGILFVEAI